MKKNRKTYLVGMMSLAMIGAAGSANAITVTLDVGLTDPYALGDCINAIQAGGQVARDVIMVNNLLTVPLSSSSTIPAAGDDTYTRSGNIFSPLPAATATGAQMASGIGDATTAVSVTLTPGFTYLLAAYDGPNGGAQIWYVGGLAAGTVIEMPRYAQPTTAGHPGVGPLVAGTRYLMTGWTLLNPSTSVPDGGLTILLLGLALTGLGVVRRSLS